MTKFALQKLTETPPPYHHFAEKDKQESSFASKAFGQMAAGGDQVAKQWADRRMSRASKMSKVSRGTQGTNQLASQLEANIVESKPINTVLNWPLIVRKYYESIGISQQQVEDETSEEKKAEGEAKEENAGNKEEAAKA